MGYDIKGGMIRCLFCFLWLPLAIFLGSTETETIKDIEKKVVEIGQLQFLQPVPVIYLKREELIRYVSQLIEKEYSADLAQKEMEFGIMMGFFDRPFSLIDLKKKIIGDNVGGLYNEKTKELLALEEFRAIDMFNVLTLIHELRHAIQDQHFQIAKMLKDYSDFDDRYMAVLAALEGDATLLMVQYMGIDPEIVASALQPETIFSFAALPGVSSLIDAPNRVKYQLLMPYLDGLKFSAYVFNKKKWVGVNAILKNPPQSTEQILHPEKYMSNERPAPVFVRYRPEGWDSFFSGVIGEYFLNVLLKSTDEIKDSAAGWGGDCFYIFKKGDANLIVWKSCWDSPQDGNRFYFDFRRFLEKKFKVEFVTGDRKGKSFIAGNSPSGYFFLRNVGNTIFFVRTDDRTEINKLIDGGMYD